MDVDSAISITLKELKAGAAGSYGYELYPPKIASKIAYQSSGGQSLSAGPIELELDPIFFEAAWHLCRRGIVRPGPKDRNAQAVPASGYCLTVFGKNTLQNLTDDEVVVMQPGSLAAALANYTGLFGEAFQQRAQEAIACRNAEAWLACCTMAGAAAESVILVIATTKTTDEDKVWKDYNATGGRQKIVNMIVGQLPDWQKTTFKSFAGIISLWRDEAAHGAPTTLTTANADEALRQLLHMCQWVKKYWSELTAQ